MNINTSEVCLLLTVLGVFSIRERTLGLFSGAPRLVKVKKKKRKERKAGVFPQFTPHQAGRRRDPLFLSRLLTSVG